MAALPESRCRALAATAPVARLATLRPDGTPRLVPITFVLVDGLVCSIVDDVKPKRSTRLARLDDVGRDPRAAVLVDHYSPDWTQLWWVRIDGTARVLHGPSGDPAGRPDDIGLWTRALDALARKYPQYGARSLTGPMLVLTPAAWAGWSAR